MAFDPKSVSSASKPTPLTLGSEVPPSSFKKPKAKNQTIVNMVDRVNGVSVPVLTDESAPFISTLQTAEATPFPHKKRTLVATADFEQYLLNGLCGSQDPIQYLEPLRILARLCFEEGLPPFKPKAQDLLTAFVVRYLYLIGLAIEKDAHEKSDPLKELYPDKQIQPLPTAVANGSSLWPSLAMEIRAFIIHSLVDEGSPFGLRLVSVLPNHYVFFARTEELFRAKTEKELNNWNISDSTKNPVERCFYLYSALDVYIKIAQAFSIEDERPSFKRLERHMDQFFERLLFHFKIQFKNCLLHANRRWIKEMTNWTPTLIDQLFSLARGNFNDPYHLLPLWILVATSPLCPAGFSLAPFLEDAKVTQPERIKLTNQFQTEIKAEIKRLLKEKTPYHNAKAFQLMGTIAEPGMGFMGFYISILIERVASPANYFSKFLKLFTPEALPEPTTRAETILNLIDGLNSFAEKISPKLLNPEDLAHLETLLLHLSNPETPQLYQDFATRILAKFRTLYPQVRNSVGPEPKNAEAGVRY